jgi:hypothetical protein
MNKIVQADIEGETLRLKLRRNDSLYAPLAALGMEMLMPGATVQVEQGSGDLIVAHVDVHDPRFTAKQLTADLRTMRYVRKIEHSRPGVNPLIVALDLQHELSPDCFGRFRDYLMERLPELNRVWQSEKLVCLMLMNAEEVGFEFGQRMREPLSFMF